MEADEPLGACTWTHLRKDQNTLVTLTNTETALK